MIRLFTLVSIVLLLASCGQYIPTEIVDGKLLGVIPVKHQQGYYQEIHRLNATREDLFRQARKWTAFKLPRAATALNISDNLTNDVIGNGSFVQVVVKEERRYVTYPQIEYALSIECYDNAYRVTVSRIEIGSSLLSVKPVEIRHTDTSRKAMEERFKMADRKINALLADLNEFIHTEVQQEI